MQEERLRKCLSCAGSSPLLKPAGLRGVPPPLKCRAAAPSCLTCNCSITHCLLVGPHLWAWECQSVTAPNIANATAQEYAAVFAGQLASASSMGCLDFMPAPGFSSPGLCIAQGTRLGMHDVQCLPAHKEPPLALCRPVCLSVFSLVSLAPAVPIGLRSPHTLRISPL